MPAAAAAPEGQGLHRELPEEQQQHTTDTGSGSSSSSSSSSGSRLRSSSVAAAAAEGAAEVSVAAGAAAGRVTGTLVAAAARTAKAHPAGPFTIHFWAPTLKWGISIANIMDLRDKGVETVSPAQQTACAAAAVGLAVAATGLIWSRYSMVIKPKNWNLFSVNVVMACTGCIQLGRLAYAKLSSSGSSSSGGGKESDIMSNKGSSSSCKDGSSSSSGISKENPHGEEKLQKERS
ncbi:hypothetical protein Efla_007831 [Eimeria flavescens]